MVEHRNRILLKILVQDRKVRARRRSRVEVSMYNDGQVFNSTVFNLSSEANYFLTIILYMN